MIGESPQRPGSLKARPLVVVTPEISPLSLSAEQWMVPVGGNSTRRAAAVRNSGSIPSCAARSSRRDIRRSFFSFQSSQSSFRSSDCGGGGVCAGEGGFHCGSANPGPHQSSEEWYSFHSSQILRERSVNRFSRGK